MSLKSHHVKLRDRDTAYVKDLEVPISILARIAFIEKVESMKNVVEKLSDKSKTNKSTKLPKDILDILHEKGFLVKYINGFPIIMGNTLECTKITA